MATCRSLGIGMPTVVVTGANGWGRGVGPAQARACGAAAGAVSAVPTAAAGTGADGVTELVISCDGRPWSKLSGPELEVQPDMIRPARTNAGRAEGRMETRTQNKNGIALRTHG